MRITIVKQKRLGISLGMAKYAALKDTAKNNRPSVPPESLARCSVQHFLKWHHGQKLVLNDERRK